MNLLFGVHGCRGLLHNTPAAFQARAVTMEIKIVEMTPEPEFRFSQEPFF